MAPHSNTLAWKIPRMKEPGRLQSMGSLRAGHDWAASLSLFTCMHWRRKRQPTPVFLPGESQGRGSLVGCVYGVPQSRTRLKRLSSSSSAYVSRLPCPLSAPSLSGHYTPYDRHLSRSAPLAFCSNFVFTTNTSLSLKNCGKWCILRVWVRQRFFSEFYADTFCHCLSDIYHLRRWELFRT